MKGEIKKWRKTKSSCDEGGVKALKMKVDNIDNKAEFNGGLNSQDKENRINFMKSIMEMESLKIKDLKQKAKVKWVTQGDENTRFFRGMLSSKYKKSRIHGFKINGTWVSNPHEIKVHAFEFYSKKLKIDDTKIRPRLTNSIFKKLSREDVLLLDYPFSLEEIKDAV